MTPKNKEESIPDWAGIIIAIIILVFLSYQGKCKNDNNTDTASHNVYDSSDPVRPAGNIDLGYDDFTTGHEDFDIADAYEDEIQADLLEARSEALSDLAYQEYEQSLYATEDAYEKDGCPHGCTYHPPGCDIKGNISYNSNEKIYHLPHQKYYAETVINPSYGERWFCTEREALANRWRKSSQ